MKSFLPRSFIILMFSTYSFVYNFSQNTTKDISIYKDYFEEGLYFFKKKDYNEALYFFLKLLEYQPDNAHFNFKVGETYLNIPGKEAKAIPYLEKAVRSLVPKNKYKENSFEEINAPLHALFYLGIAYRINNQLDEALKAYEEFINSPYFLYNYNQSIVENEIKACERAKIIYDNPIKINVTLLNSDINTSAAELFPIVNDDETVLIFVRKLKFYDAIFYTVKDNNSWKEPRNINEEIGSDGDLYPSCISKDGKVLYLIKHTMRGTDVYVSYLDNDRWTKAILIGKPISTNAEENYVFVNNDDNIMLFCSDRFGGYGGMDIYISKKNTNGKWEKPKKLPRIVNSEFDEARPYLIPTKENNYRLFFSSQSFYNMGGYDIFISDFNKEKNTWSEPKNIGYPINDTGDNIFYTPARGGKVFYLSKMNPETENEDIYRIEIID